MPERFAIDFYLLDDQHRPWVGDPSKLTGYPTYRKPITAAAAGTVVAAQDGLPDSSSLPNPSVKLPDSEITKLLRRSIARSRRSCTARSSGVPNDSVRPAAMSSSDLRSESLSAGTGVFG